MLYKMYQGYKVCDNGIICCKKGGLKRLVLSKTTGYLEVTLYHDGKNHTHQVHRLMGILFLPNFYGKPTVDHIDCKTTTNNSLYNLRWATYREQVLNQRLKSSNTSGVKGVFYNKRDNRWVSTISPSVNKRINKNFLTKLEAIEQRVIWEEIYYNKSI